MMDKDIDSVVLRALDLYKKANDIPSNYSLANYLGVTQGTLSRWYNGKSKTIKYSAWKKVKPLINKYLDKAQREEFTKKVEDGSVALINPSHTVYFIADSQEEHDLIASTLDKVVEISGKKCAATERIKQVDQPETINFPHITEKISAGNGIHDDFQPYGNRPDLYLMDVKGESMQTSFRDGDKVVVHLYSMPVIFGSEFLPMSMVKALIPEGSIIVYERNGDGRAMKRVKYKDGTNTWYLKLIADNQEWAEENKFQHIVRKGEEFKIIGTVLGKLK